MSLDVSGLAVGRIERLIALRSFPMYAQLPTATVVRISERMVQRRYRKGEYLCREGEPSTYIHFIVRGEVEIRRRGKVLRRLGDLSVAGGVAALAEDPHGYDVQALVDTTTLRMSNEDSWDTFEDHYSLVSGLIQRLSLEVFELRKRLPNFGFQPTDWEGGDEPEAPLDLVGRMATLRQVLSFAGTNVEALADLARDVREVRFEDGTELWREGDSSRHFFYIRHGVVRAQTDGLDLRFGPGDTVGTLGSSAHVPRWFTAVTEGPVIALQVDRDSMHDVLEDHFHFSRRMATAISKLLLELMETTSTESVAPPASQAVAAQ